jgi:hypothetical protein
MKRFAAVLFLLLPTSAIAAGGPVALGANGGKFGDWTAATYGSGAAKACYAFTSATHSSPAIPGRGGVLLTVTQRHGDPDEVTLAAGFTYPAKAAVKLTIGTTPFDFYTQAGTAFTSAGHDAVAALKTGASAQAVATGPKGKPVTDDFSLSGFSGAYSAIDAACP